MKFILAYICMLRNPHILICNISNNQNPYSHDKYLVTFKRYQEFSTLVFSCKPIVLLSLCEFCKTRDQSPRRLSWVSSPPSIYLKGCRWSKSSFFLIFDPLRTLSVYIYSWVHVSPQEGSIVQTPKQILEVERYVISSRAMARNTWQSWAPFTNHA